jgi:hypothetical protein
MCAPRRSPMVVVVPATQEMTRPQKYDVKHHSVQGAPPPAAEVRRVPLRGRRGMLGLLAEI